MRKIIFLLLFISLSELLGDDMPWVSQERPRVICSASRFQWLKNNLQNGECKETFDLFKYRYENWWINDPELYLEGEDSTKWTWDWYSSWARDESVYTALMFKLTDDELALKRCRFIFRKFLEIVDTINYNNLSWYEKEEFFRKMSDAIGIPLDWCYDYLPSDLRAKVVQAFYSMNRAFMDIFILSSAGNSYVSSHNAWNCVFAMQNTLVLFHSEDLSFVQDENVLNWYTTLYNKWEKGFLPVYGYYRDDDGGWNWGVAYSLWSLMDQFILFDNMLISTGKNYFKDLSWVRNSINQYWYFIQPNNYCIHLGDGVTKLSLDNAVYRHAEVFKDPRSMWLVQEYSKPNYLTNTKSVYFKLLYKDFEQPNIEKPNLPLDWWSDKVGLAVSRTNWQSDAVLLWFFNSPSKRAAHEHRDNNTFAIFYKSPLIIDAGHYDLYNSSHYLNYYSRTIAHNTICVFDPNEQFFYSGNLLSNDGGQIYSNALQNYEDIFKSENQRGKWLLYGANKNYAYYVADATLSYNQDKLKNFVRKLFYYKPNKVLVIDYLVLNNPNERKLEPKWVAHFVNKPFINAEPVNIIVPEHIEEFPTSNYLASNGGAYISIRTLLPENNLVRLIGGEGYEYWVDGNNYPPVRDPDTIGGTPGKWRIEVLPNKNEILSDTLLFLHLLNIGDNENFSAEKFESDISLAVLSDSIIFIFNKLNEINSKYHLIEYNKIGNFKLVAFDLKPFSLYDIFVNNQVQFSLEADSNGVIETDIYLNNEINKIEIKESSSFVQFKNQKSKNYIRVIDNILFLHFDDIDDEPICIEIYDLWGRKVLAQEINTPFQINVKNLPSGIYLAIIKSPNNQLIKSFNFLKIE